MSHAKEHIIMLSVDAYTSDEVVKAFETLSRVGASLALDEIDVRINHYVVEQVCEECMEMDQEHDHE